MSENIETPEGWERRGPFLFRQYGESFATIRSDGDGDWVANVSHEQDAEQGWERECADAVAWANEQLGVPKPVEVVEIECEDGVLLYADDKSKSSKVHCRNGRWWYVMKKCSDWKPTQAEAIEAARAYVRGDA